MSPSDQPIVDDPDAVVINDRRRLDPQTGQVRPPASWGPGLQAPDAGAAGPATGDATTGAPTPGASTTGAPTPGTPIPGTPTPGDAGPGDGDPDAGAGAAAPGEAVAELTADLQRVSAEYANYRKRVDRDRVAVVDMATAGLLSGLLPVLDDVDRAREHGDLTGAFKGVADQLEALTAKLGLERFGAVGDPFDPAVHEALLQAAPDPGQTVATCAAVFQPGYRLTAATGIGRVLRPARVSVAEPDAGQ